MITHPEQRHQAHFAINWQIFSKIEILILLGLELKGLQPWQCQNLNFEKNRPSYVKVLSPQNRASNTPAKYG